MTRLRRALTGRLAAAFGVLAIMANIMAPAALAGVGARANAAMFVGPFNAPICHGGSIANTPPADADTTPGLHCPLCPAPAATALAASTATTEAVSFRWLSNPVAARTARTVSFALPSDHRPRAPPSGS